MTAGGCVKWVPVWLGMLISFPLGEPSTAGPPPRPAEPQASLRVERSSTRRRNLDHAHSRYRNLDHLPHRHAHPIRRCRNFDHGPHQRFARSRGVETSTTITTTYRPCSNRRDNTVYRPG